jgi:hypothetical protein
MSGTINNRGYKETEDKVMEKKDIKKVEKRVTEEIKKITCL